MAGSETEDLNLRLLHLNPGQGLPFGMRREPRHIDRLIANAKLFNVLSRRADQCSILRQYRHHHDVQRPDRCDQLEFTHESARLGHAATLADHDVAGVVHDRQPIRSPSLVI